MKGHFDDVTTIITNGNEEIISGSYDGTIKIWNINSARILINF